MENYRKAKKQTEVSVGESVKILGAPVPTPPGMRVRICSISCRKDANNGLLWPVTLGAHSVASSVCEKVGSFCLSAREVAYSQCSR